jgi:hypothetical protein
MAEDCVGRAITLGGLDEKFAQLRRLTFTATIRIRTRGTSLCMDRRSDDQRWRRTTRSFQPLHPDLPYIR